jgi:hypothetical protein
VNSKGKDEAKDWSLKGAATDFFSGVRGLLAGAGCMRGGCYGGKEKENHPKKEQ